MSEIMYAIVILSMKRFIEADLTNSIGLNSALSLQGKFAHTTLKNHVYNVDLLHC